MKTIDFEKPEFVRSRCDEGGVYILSLSSSYNYSIVKRQIDVKLVKFVL